MRGSFIAALVVAASLAAASGGSAWGSACRTPTAVGAPGCPLTVQVRVTLTGMRDTSASQTQTTASCSRGASVIGGGILQESTEGALPNNGLRIHGTVPSTPGGTPLANGSHDPSAWTVIGGFGGQSEAGDQVEAFVLCGSSGPNRTLVVSKTLRGPDAAATDEIVTVSCPAGSTLLGGGGSTSPASDPSLKTIGSYPSTMSGAPVAAGAADPRSWTAVGAAGGMKFGAGGPTTTVYALCGLDDPLQTVVARADIEKHPAGPGNVNPGSDPFAIATATCKLGTTLVSGGVLTNGNSTDPNGVPQQGVHVRGSYPSDAKGAPLGGGATDPASWTVIVQSGGQATPGTNTHAFALCAS